MAYNESLAQVIREETSGVPGLVEKNMFGGIVFLLNGNMAVGVHKDNLIVRLGKGKHDEALLKPHTKTFDITGRPMKGWIMIMPEGHGDEVKLRELINLGITFAGTLPHK